MLVRVIRSVRFQSGVSIRSLNQSRLPCVTTQIQHFAAKAAQQEHPQDLEKFSLKEFNISNAMVNHLESINIHSLFPVQAATLETALSGRDVIGKSKTGSGKTLAFVLPIVEKITEQGFSGKLPRALILAPTRELAIQVHSELRKVAPVVRSVCLYGGASYEPQIRSLIGGVDVVVGTPGRVMDHIKTGYLNTSNICIWVLDEADRMLETGFWEQVKMIGDSLPEKRQNMLWSATFPSSVVELCNQFSNDAAYFDLVGDENKIPESIKHYAIPVSANGRYFLLPDIIKGLINGDVIPGMHKPNRILVFCETKRDAEALSSFHDIPYAQSLHGGMSQSARERALNRFRAGNCKVLIATDVAARGLDIPEVDYVFHASFPRHVDSFVHRTGRTARAGRSGTNIAMITQDNLKMVSQIEKETGISFTRIAYNNVASDQNSQNYTGSPFSTAMSAISGNRQVGSVSLLGAFINYKTLAIKLPEPNPSLNKTLGTNMVKSLLMNINMPFPLGAVEISKEKDIIYFDIPVDSVDEALNTNSSNHFTVEAVTEINGLELSTSQYNAPEKFYGASTKPRNFGERPNNTRFNQSNDRFGDPRNFGETNRSYGGQFNRSNRSQDGGYGEFSRRSNNRDFNRSRNQDGGYGEFSRRSNNRDFNRSRSQDGEYGEFSRRSNNRDFNRSRSQGRYNEYARGQNQKDKDPFLDNFGFQEKTRSNRFEDDIFSDLHEYDPKNKKDPFEL